MKPPDLGAVVRIDDDLYELVSIAEGTTLNFRKVGIPPCALCGQERWRSYLLHAPNLAKQVKPVTTVTL